MKGKAYGRYAKTWNGVLYKGAKIKKELKFQNELNDLPYVVLRELVSFLHGYDALSFVEFSSQLLMNSERQFWKSIGM
jgi:hypothetical protein